MKWLDTHPPQACYADLYGSYRLAMRAIRDALRDIATGAEQNKGATRRQGYRDLHTASLVLAEVDNLIGALGVAGPASCR